jgi:hypothetical protein
VTLKVGVVERWRDEDVGSVKSEEWILFKNNIRQDLQDHLDRRAFGLKVSRRRRKKSY